MGDFIPLFTDEEEAEYWNNAYKKLRVHDTKDLRYNPKMLQDFLESKKKIEQAAAAERAKKAAAAKKKKKNELAIAAKQAKKAPVDVTDEEKRELKILRELERNKRQQAELLESKKKKEGELDEDLFDQLNSGQMWGVRCVCAKNDQRKKKQKKNNNNKNVGGV